MGGIGREREAVSGNRSWPMMKESADCDSCRGLRRSPKAGHCYRVQVLGHRGRHWGIRAASPPKNLTPMLWLVSTQISTSASNPIHLSISKYLGVCTLGMSNCYLSLCLHSYEHYAYPSVYPSTPACVSGCAHIPVRVSACVDV